jgi:anti-sigma factor RsiW
MRSLWHKLRFRRDHRWTPPHISAYLDSDLSARARMRLQRHAAECPECRSVVEDLAHLLALLQSAPAPQPLAAVPAITSAVLRRLHEPAGR